METAIFKLSPMNPVARKISEIARILKDGGIVAYPTETCYGLACDATNTKAIKKIYKIKGRSARKPISIIVADLRTMKKYGKIDERIVRLARRFMPGPLSIITRKTKAIPSMLNPNEICFRISSNKIAHALAKKLGKPITATSANISGKEPIYGVGDLIGTFNGKVDAIIDAGNLRRTRPSTVICLKNEPKVIRKGPISEKRLMEALGVYA